MNLNDVRLSKQQIKTFISYADWLINEIHSVRTGDRRRYENYEKTPQSYMLFKTFINNYMRFESTFSKSKILSIFNHLIRQFEKNTISYFKDVMIELYKYNKPSLYDIETAKQSLPKDQKPKAYNKKYNTILSFMEDK